MAAAQLRSGLWQLANRSRQLVGKELGQRRSFGAGAGHEGAAGESLSYAGLTLHKPPEWKIKYAEFWGAAMWFWLFYRCYHDGAVAFGLKSPSWEEDLLHDIANGKIKEDELPSKFRPGRDHFSY